MVAVAMRAHAAVAEKRLVTQREYAFGSRWHPRRGHSRGESELVDIERVGHRFAAP